MIPTLVAKGVRETYHLLHDIAARAGDAQPAWEKVGDDVFIFQHRHWLTTFGGKRDKDTRPGRDPRYMYETGGLFAAATRRGAGRQTAKAGPTFFLLEVTHGLAKIHEARGREVLGTPTSREVRQWTEKVASYILTGRV